MNENRRNIIVALFAGLGLVILGWLVLKFGDLPTIVSRYDAREIAIYFPEAPGIQENTAVLFRGYRVGKVVEVAPPALLEDLEDSTRKHYQVEVTVAISKDYHIPANVVPKVYRRGLGGSFVELALDGPVVADMIKDGDRYRGVVSEASEFISEGTQRKLDRLITSLTDLTDQIKVQLQPLPPHVVDQADPNRVHANVTTAVMRLDRSLKYLNVFLGDVENQHHFKEGLADFAALSGDIRDAVAKIKDVTQEAKHLIEKSTDTVGTIGEFAEQANISFQQFSLKLQQTADQLAKVLGHMDEMLIKVNAGEGTVGKAFNDPRLYEALTDASRNLSIAVKELCALLEQWKAKGVKTKLF